MVFALAASFFFALSAILARRSALLVGAQRANLARQLIALFLLGLWAHLAGQGLHGATLGLMVVSGMVGFGVGDWALFEALPRLGSALTILLCQCLAAPIAALIEWLWLGTVMTPGQFLGSAVILTGVVLALAPSGEAVPVGHRGVGIAFGLVAAAGQAGGAVLSRYAFQRAAESGFVLDGITAAYQRLWGGVLSIGFLLLLRHAASRWLPRKEPGAPATNWKAAWPWVVANALAGATIGVSCYQWALQASPSAVVLPIVALTPLEVMLLAFAMEGTRPRPRAVVGSVLAVAGVWVLLSNA